MFSAKIEFYSGKSCGTRTKWLYLGKSGCVRAKVFVYGRSS